MWEWLVSSPLLFVQSTFCIVHEKTSTHSTAAQLRGWEGPHASDETQRQQRGIYCEGISPEAQQSPLAIHAPWCHGSLVVGRFAPGGQVRQARRMTMQGRAGKAPKREMVIESPQQYKCLAEIEAEVEPGSQVAGVSDAGVYLKTPVQQMLA